MESPLSRPAPPGQAGDLVITEIMANPSAVDDSVGEWFELFNPSSTTFINLYGLVVQDDDGDFFTIDATVVLGPGQHVLLADAQSPIDDGLGRMPDFDYDGMTLDNDSDEFELIMGGTTIDHTRCGTGRLRLS